MPHGPWEAWGEESVRLVEAGGAAERGTVQPPTSDAEGLGGIGGYILADGQRLQLSTVVQENFRSFFADRKTYIVP